MSRRSVLLAVAAGAAAVAVLRRRAAASAGHVDVLYDDGSLVPLDPDGPQAERMLALAREAIAAARLPA